MKSLVCKSTIVPSDVPISFHPLSLGDKLVGVTTNDPAELSHLKEQGLDLEGEELQLSLPILG